MDKFEISWISLWRILLMTALAVGLFLIHQVIIILLLAIVMSSAIDVPITFLEKRRIPRILATLFIFIIVLIGLAFLLYALIPATYFELRNLLKNLDQLEIPL